MATRALAGVVLLAAACTRAAPPVPIVRLFQAPARAQFVRGGTELPLPAPERIDLFGEVRPAVVVLGADKVLCHVTLPDVPCWLDVAAAVAPRAGEPPTPVLLDVVQSVGTERRVLFHALPSAGTPPTAIGFGRARLELTEHLGESVVLEFAATPATAVAEPSACILAEPWLTPRVDATATPWNFLEWRLEGPPAASLAPGAVDLAALARQLPGFARFLAEDGSVAVVRCAATGEVAADPALEWQAFGAVADVPTRDRVARTDPLFVSAGAGGDGGDPALAAFPQLDAATRRVRPRALGERTLLLELARPRAHALRVEAASHAPLATADAALGRLLDWLAANDLGARTVVVLAVEGGAIARLPRNWRDAAPAGVQALVRARVGAP